MIAIKEMPALIKSLGSTTFCLIFPEAYIALKNVFIVKRLKRKNIVYNRPFSSNIIIIIIIIIITIIIEVAGSIPGTSTNVKCELDLERGLPSFVRTIGWLLD